MHDFAACPACSGVALVRLRGDWRNSDAIPVVGCGNPWHYATASLADRPDPEESRSLRPYDLWRCDECRLVFPHAIPQSAVRVQQTTERIHGTETVHRPVESLVLCPTCHARLAHGLDASKRLPCIDVCAAKGHPHLPEEPGAILPSGRLRGWKGEEP